MQLVFRFLFNRNSLVWRTDCHLASGLHTLVWNEEIRTFNNVLYVTYFMSMVPKLFSLWPKRQIRHLPGTQTSENNRSTSSQRAASRWELVDQLFSLVLKHLCSNSWSFFDFSLISSWNYWKKSLNFVFNSWIY